MGTMASMDCGCGYTAMATVGAGRREFQSVCQFPHYCANCGVVSPNLLVDDLLCPTCGGVDIIRYGEAMEKKQYHFMGFHLSIWDRNEWKYDERVTKPSGNAILSWNSYRITRGQHLCPACGAFSLEIGTGDIGWFS